MFEYEVNLIKVTRNVYTLNLFPRKIRAQARSDQVSANYLDLSSRHIFSRDL